MIQSSLSKRIILIFALAGFTACGCMLAQLYHVVPVLNCPWYRSTTIPVPVLILLKEWNVSGAIYYVEGQSHDKTVSTVDRVADPDSYRYLYEREKINTKYIISYVNVIHLNIFINLFLLIKRKLLFVFNFLSYVGVAPRSYSEVNQKFFGLS